MSRTAGIFHLLFLFFGLVSSLLHPIVLIPGDGGSQIEAKLNKTSVIHYICQKTSDWFPLWLNLEQMVPEVIDCWADNMKLRYNVKTRKTSNNVGVDVRVPGFGNTSTVEYLDTSERSFSVYFANIVKFLLPLGYQRGVNLHGAPYDFRKAPNEGDGFFASLKEQIEETYVANGDQKVILLAHSMGSPMSHYFLNHQTQAWKDKYIRSLISLAGVWGGTVRAMKVFAIGDNLGAWIISGKSLMVEQRTSPSLAWLMPSDEFWKQDEILLSNDKQNFTVGDFQQFFDDLKEPLAYEMFKDVRDLSKGLPAPNVEVFCMHGVGVPTTEKLEYGPGEWPAGTPTLIPGDGDGTVNLRSLLGCMHWTDKQSQKVHHHTFNATDHLAILRNDVPAQYVSSIVNSLNIENERKNTPIIEIVP